MLLKVVKLLLIVIISCLSLNALAISVYQTEEDFLANAFFNTTPKPKVIWMHGNVKKKTTEILGHAYPSLRIRYWRKAEKTVWILDEVGKERAITTGFVITNHQIEQVKVLVFRESRGSEVRYDFFTDQFKSVRLTDGLQLNQSIDGITGATLSVRALKKLTRLALYLDSMLMGNNGR